MSLPAADGTGKALEASAISDVRQAHTCLHKWLEDPDHAPGNLVAAMRYLEFARAAMNGNDEGES